MWYRIPMTTSENAQTMTPKEAAAYIGRSVRTLDRWQITGKLNPVNRVVPAKGAQREYLVSDLDAFIAKSTEVPYMPAEKLVVNPAGALGHFVYVKGQGATYIPATMIENQNMGYWFEDSDEVKVVVPPSITVTYHEDKKLGFTWVRMYQFPTKPAGNIDDIMNANIDKAMEEHLADVLIEGKLKSWEYTAKNFKVVLGADDKIMIHEVARIHAKLYSNAEVDYRTFEGSTDVLLEGAL